jgi:hypothetical protein
MYARAGSRREAGGGAAEQFAVPDAERLDPPLLSQGKCDEEPKLDQLGDREVLMEPLPEGFVGDL